MAEWEHKERNWSEEYQDDASGLACAVMIFDQEGHSRGHNSEYVDFTVWLDWQCRGGWEVFKISRESSNDWRIREKKQTWCIFRKKV